MKASGIDTSLSSHTAVGQRQFLRQTKCGYLWIQSCVQLGGHSTFRKIYDKPIVGISFAETILSKVDTA